LKFHIAKENSYDIHGNVHTLLQDNPSLSTIAQQFKRMEYTYDLISGNVHEVRYQPGEADQYTHRYTYDADNRIVDVYTSKVATANWTTTEALPALYQSGDGEDGIGFDHDAHYIYYDHGPLARVELGDNQVQGIDYAYNLQGWLKGTNSAALTTDKDMGRDSDFATTDNTNKFFAKDVASFNLNYFEGDYSAIGDNTWLPTYAAIANILSNREDLWNGNIGMMQTNLTPTAGHETDPGAGMLGMVYQYDQLNRIKDAQGYMNFTGGEWQANSAPENMYRNQFTYDANGNILSQRRADREEHFFDELTYNYNSDNGKVHQNRLYSVDDIGTASLYADDFEDQDAFVLNNINSTNNYSYTEIGELKSDKAEKIDEIIWRVDSKISEVNRTTESGKNNLKFDYDAMGNRVAKYIYTENALHIWELTKTIYYLRDASGNVMAVYELVHSSENETTSMKVTERHIYGSSRLGMDVQSIELIDQEGPLLDTSQFRILGLKQYEISNHLGNVLSVVSDLKLATTLTQNNSTTIVGYKAVVISATDYSPFGVGLYERSWSAPEYRYGFNGKEKDDEFSGEGNSYDFGARIYDGRLGRWASVDRDVKIYPSLSSYCFVGNSVNMFVDPDGNGIKPANRASNNAIIPLLCQVLGGASPRQARRIFQLTVTQESFKYIDEKGKLQEKGQTVYRSRNARDNVKSFEDAVQKSVSNGSMTEDQARNAKAIFNMLVDPEITEVLITVGNNLENKGTESNNNINDETYVNTNNGNYDILKNNLTVGGAIANSNLAQPCNRTGLGNEKIDGNFGYYPNIASQNPNIRGLLIINITSSTSPAKGGDGPYGGIDLNAVLSITSNGLRSFETNLATGTTSKTNETPYARSSTKFFNKETK
jgi:RHS repeat-associated protein